MLAATLLPALLTMGLGGFPDDPPRPPPEPEVKPSGPTESRWYGWESLLTDAVSMTVLLDGDLPTAARVAGGAGLILGVPVVHLANGNRRSFVASLAVRGGVVVLGELIAVTTRTSCGSDSACKAAQPVNDAGAGAIGFGVLLGGLVFAIVDDTVLSRVDVPITPTGSSAPQSHASNSGWPRLSPLLAPTRGGMSLGFGAAF